MGVAGSVADFGIQQGPLNIQTLSDSDTEAKAVRKWSAPRAVERNVAHEILVLARSAEVLDRTQPPRRRGCVTQYTFG